MLPNPKARFARADKTHNDNCKAALRDSQTQYAPLGKSLRRPEIVNCSPSAIACFVQDCSHIFQAAISYLANTKEACADKALNIRIYPGGRPESGEPETIRVDLDLVRKKL